MVIIKSPEQIHSMRKAGKILADTLSLIEEKAKIGVSTKYLDKLAYEYITAKGAVPSFLNYGGFPATICASIDEQVVHGIPSDNTKLEEGMLLKIDCGAGIDGMHTDAARTIAIGNVSKEKQKLMEVCKQSFFEGVKILKAGVRLGDLGHTIQNYVEGFGFGVIRDLVGHGIGATVHEDPNVPNYGIKGRGARLWENITIAIEPMITLGTYEIEQLNDGWTIVTADGKPSAHYENTVVIMPDGVEILTL
ncbi:MAG: type I methionyl aminopeptidase [Clostridiales bacterium]|nr:type I methionyl aminopeptidase [Clostridiales bacterium]